MLQIIAGEGEWYQEALKVYLQCVLWNPVILIIHILRCTGSPTSTPPHPVTHLHTHTQVVQSTLSVQYTEYTIHNTLTYCFRHSVNSISIHTYNPDKCVIYTQSEGMYSQTRTHTHDRCTYYNTHRAKPSDTHKCR